MVHVLWEDQSRSLMRTFDIIISYRDEAITKSFKEGYIMLFIACLGRESTAIIVMQLFRSSTIMLVSCKNSLWYLLTDFIMPNVTSYNKSNFTIRMHCVMQYIRNTATAFVSEIYFIKYISETNEMSMF